MVDVHPTIRLLEHRLLSDDEFSTGYSNEIAIDGSAGWPGVCPSDISSGRF